MRVLLNKLLDVGSSVVLWKATFYLAVVRSCSASIILAVVNLFGGDPQFFLVLLGGPFMILLFLVPVALLGDIIGRVFPPAGFAALPALVCFALGDPLVWVVGKINPKFVPVEKFGIFNWRWLIIVLDDGVVAKGKEAFRGAVSEKASSALAEMKKRVGGQSNGNV
jgi:hypothetical protein